MATNIKARKKLSALYARGVEVRFFADGGQKGPFDEPATDDQVALWVQPPSPLQREQALRDANAARAKSLLRIRKDPESEEALTTQAFVAEMSDDTLIEYLLEYDSDVRRNEAIRDVLADDEWKDFGAYQDAMRPYDDGELEPDPDDPEYAALMDADQRYGQQVLKRQMELYEADKEALKILSRAAWERRAIEKRADLMGSQIFMQEYERQMTFYSVRDLDDHSMLFFESAREWADQEPHVQEMVSNCLADFLREVADVKNSPRAVDGSQQSAPPSEPETTEASTPVELNE